MRKVSLLFTIVALLTVAVFPGFAQDEEPGTIADIVVASATGEEPEFTILLTAVQAADPAVLEALSDPEAEYTVFAPTDEAFMALIEEIGQEAFDAIVADTEALTEILLYHVVDGAAAAEDVAGLLEANDGAFTVPSLTEERLDISTEMDNIYVDNAQVIATDIMASNGIIHVIDSVLLPEDGTIADLVVEAASDEEAPEFTTLLAAVQAADPSILEALSDDMGEGLTVFAPTDEAFAALDAATLEAALADPELLTSILAYHVVPGWNYASDVATAIEEAGGTLEVETLSGEVLTFTVSEEGNVVINDTVTVIAYDVDAANGVIHVIDGVLLPPME